MTGDKFAAFVKATFESLPDLSPQPCIYKAPDHLREVNEECYLPCVISIGPLYKGRQRLAPMEDCKLRCLKFFLEHESNKLDVGQYMRILRELEVSVRDCYAESIDLDTDKFNWMILVDSAFIICLFMKFHPILSSSRLLFEMDKRSLLKWGYKLRRDLFLEENQIPFFVLERLFRESFGAVYPSPSFLDLACSFIANGKIPLVYGLDIAAISTKEKIRSLPEIKHLVDLLRNFCFPPTLSDDSSTIIQFPSSASNLCDAEVKIVASESTNLPVIKHLVDLLRNFCFPPTLSEQVLTLDSTTIIQFPSSASNLCAAGVKIVASESTNLLEITFSKGVLKIPPFQILDVSESYFRSMILFEQSHLPIIEHSYLVHYMVLLEKLIRTPEDVQILVRCGIIDNWIGSEDTVARLFDGRITKHIALPVNFYYRGLCQELNAYANTRWNQWKAILKRDYFSHPWATISVIYALMLLILALLQTIGTFIKK